jgi:hypothetical protein
MAEPKKKISRKERLLSHLGKVAMGTISASFLLAPLSASAINSADVAGDVIGSEGGKRVLNEALSLARNKPALTIATGVTYIPCIPVSGAVASPGPCVACGFLIVKTFS